LAIVSIVIAVVAAILALAPAPQAGASPRPGGVTGQFTVDQEDFARVMGYRPVPVRLANGDVVQTNPRGGCSMPGGRAADDIEATCRAHDLGYDKLRYARDRGRTAGPDARRAIDDQFAHDLAIQCAGRATAEARSGCATTATIFTAAVRFNSWRQEEGPPVASSGMGRTVALSALALLAVGGIGALIVRISRRRVAAR